MFATSREVKDAFFGHLQQAVSAVPLGMSFVLLGNFNARVGSRVEEDEWWYVRIHMGTDRPTRQGRSC